MTHPRFLLPLLAPFVLAACGGGDADTAAEAEPADTAIPVEVVVVEPAPFEDVIELTGSVEAPDDATLGAESSGTLTYLAPLGAFVRVGGTVAQVNPSLAQAQVSQAEAAVAGAEAQRQAAQAQLALAQDQYDRQEPLYRDSIISALEFQGVQTQLASARAQVAQATAGVAQANAALRQARTGLANTRVSAPFGGTVEAHLAERGETVGPGTPVVRVVSGAGLLVAAGVPERYAGEIEVGTAVRVRPNAYEGEPLGGRVTFVGRAVDPENRTFPIEVALANTETPLRPEMVVNLQVSRTVLAGVIALPLGAILRDERGTSVFVAREDTTGLVARYQPVELGPSSGGRVVVMAGLEPGDRVLVAGQTTVADGDRIRIAEQHAGEVLPAALSGPEPVVSGQ